DPLGGAKLRVPCPALSARLDLSLQTRPARMAALARERVLDVAQCRRLERVRVGATQPRPRVRVAGANGLQPSTRFSSQIVQGGHDKPSFRGLARCRGGYAWRPLTSGRKKVRAE